VGMANILDVAVIGNGSVLRTAVIFFYISNEGVSLLENAGHLGLPIPQKMKVQWNEFECIIGTHDISNALYAAYKLSNDFVGELIKLSDEYYKEIIESGEV